MNNKQNIQFVEDIDVVSVARECDSDLIVNIARCLCRRTLKRDPNYVLTKNRRFKEAEERYFHVGLPLWSGFLIDAASSFRTMVELGQISY